MEERPNKQIKLNNNGISLPNYIYFQIINSIIDYLLINNNKTTNNNNDNKIYNIKNYFNNIQEIVTLSLISKQTYGHISLIISNNIINNKSLEYWFDYYIEPLSESLSESPSSPLLSNNSNKHFNEIIYNYYNFRTSFNFFMKINQVFSIIKINEEIINDYFNNQVLYISGFNKEKLLQLQERKNNGQFGYRKVIAEYDYYEPSTLLELLLEGGKYKNDENSILKITELNIRDVSLSNEKGDSFYNVLSNQKKKSNQDENSNPYLLIENINLKDQDDEYDAQVFKVLKYLKSKNIFYDSDVSNDPSYSNFPSLFDNDINGRAESIKVINEYVEPIDLINVEQLKHLHTLSVPLQFHSTLQFLIRCKLDSSIDFNTRIHGYCKDPSNRRNIKNEWNKMIYSLISNKSLKNLTLKNECGDSKCINTVSNSFEALNKNNCKDIVNLRQTFDNIVLESKKVLSDGIKTLLSSKSNSIKYFKLSDLSGFFTNDTFSQLIHNKSIKTLELFETIDLSYEFSNYYPVIHYLFSDVFTTNSTLKHFKFSIFHIEQFKSILDIISKNILKIQLYSITLKIDESNLNELFLSELLEQILSLSNNLNIQNQNQNLINLKEFNISIFKEYDVCDYELHNKLLQHYNNINNIFKTKIT